MVIIGEWFPGDDGIERPVIRGEVMAIDGSWVSVPFLVDTGADRTVFSAATLAALQFPPSTTHERLGGLGGVVASVIIDTQVRLAHERDKRLLFRGRYAAVTELEALDFSVLGRDVTGLFAVIVDKPSNLVCLLGQRHGYRIEERSEGL